MKTSLRVIACMAALAVLMVVQSASAQGKLEGVWKITQVILTGPNAPKVTNIQPSMAIFTKQYFSRVVITGDKPRPDLPQNATDAQKAATWGPFSAAAGTYEIKGNTITVKGQVFTVRGNGTELGKKTRETLEEFGGGGAPPPKTGR
jgi:hypothetical protein